MYFSANVTKSLFLIDQKKKPDAVTSGLDTVITHAMITGDAVKFTSLRPQSDHNEPWLKRISGSDTTCCSWFSSVST